MDISHEFTATDVRGLTNLTTTCFVSPKSTGIVSLILQFALLIVSVLVALFFFYHVGGYEYINSTENSTINDPILDQFKSLDSSAYHIDVVDSSIEVRTDNQTASTTLSWKETHHYDIVDTKHGNERSLFSTGHFPDTPMYLDILGLQLDMLELIRISTMIYVILCALWLISLALLLLSIKTELLDLVILNAIFLTLALTYAFMHAIFIAILLCCQNELSWRSTAIVIGCSVTLLCSTILSGVALALVIAWYRYIAYMNNTEKCYCLQRIGGLFKKAKREPQQRPQEYALPNTTRHSELPSFHNTRADNFTPF